MADITIIGAGLSGLIAGALLMGRHNVTVLEKQRELPNNHPGVLRFKSPALADALGIPFVARQCVICMVGGQNPLQSALRYSAATTGRLATDRSIARLAAGPIVETRWLAPAGLRGVIAERLGDRLQLGVTADPDRIDGAIISTLPMRHWVGTPTRSWPAQDVIHITAQISAPSEACGTIYNGHVSSQESWTRISIAGQSLQIELSPHHHSPFRGIAGPIAATLAEKYLGVEGVEGAKVFVQPDARIFPIDEGIRRRDLMHITDSLGIYSLGRHATWRPGLLLEDLVQDIAKIEKMIARGKHICQYEARK